MVHQFVKVAMAVGSLGFVLGVIVTVLVMQATPAQVGAVVVVLVGIGLVAGGGTSRRRRVGR